MKKDLLKKLKNYSKTAAALAVVGGTANAQIVYTDVNPDTTLNTFPSNYEIDFDADGVIDVNADLHTESSSTWYNARITPVGTNTSIVASSTYVAVLNTSNLISTSNTFVSSTTYGFALISAWSSGGSDGNWNSNIDDRYVGVKFDISGATHYGWIRVSTIFNSWDDFSMTIKDFAYQAIPDSAIYAGSVQADTAYSVVASDVSDNGNGLDLQVDFNMAADESFISEYRVMVVKTADAATFDIDSANAVIAANYTAVTPTGSNISTVLTATSNDIDGDAIINDVAYKLFVLSVTPDSILSVNNINSLSQVSNEITLTTIIPADTAYTILASDIADNGNGLDLQVDFTKADDETTVSEYRVMVVETADAATFDLTTAEAVVAANYTAITPTGSNISTALAATSNDVNGNAIVNDVAYKLFVLSIADGTNATINGLSSESNEITLTTIIPADTAYTILASDIADNGNGLDLQVDFTKADDETTVSEYRVMVVETADAATFDLTTAEAVVAANYTAITPTGSNISTALTATSNDVNGNAIVNDVAYKLFVLSIADGTNATINGLSSESNEITLTSIPAGIETNDLTTNIYPNPVSNILNIELQETDSYTVKLTDILGQEFIVKEFNGNTIKLDVSNLEKGNYILTISNNNTISTKQIIVK